MQRKMGRNGTDRTQMKIDPRVFPTILIVLDFCAGVVYAYQNDAGRSIYWFSACVLSYAVVYLIK